MTAIGAADLALLSAQAAASPRLRLNRNLHSQAADPVQRLLNAIEPGTYVRPHRHAEGRWEAFALLAGACAVLEFSPEGRVTSRIDLGGGAAVVVEVAAGAWHSLVALAPGTVLLEIKPGPYDAATDKDFAPWAPAEGDAGAAALVRWMEIAAVGRVPLPPCR